jgi:hypothetical protein
MIECQIPAFFVESSQPFSFLRGLVAGQLLSLQPGGYIV